MFLSLKIIKMEIKCLWIVIGIFAVIGVLTVESARILGLFPTWVPSHLIIEMSIIQTMIDRGHNVTVVTSLPLSQKNPPYRHIKLVDPYVPDDLFKTIIYTESGPWNELKRMLRCMNFAVNLSVIALADPNIQKLMHEETFDLVVMGLFYNQFHVGVAAHFKCPLIVVDTHRPLIETHEWIGSPLEVFYVPSMLSMEKQPLSFTGRVRNFLLTGFEFVLSRYAKMKYKSIYREFFPPDKYPSYEEATKNTSLLLHTSHFSEGPIRPDVPAFVQIGGIQIKPKPDPLPKDIQNFIENATEHGVILFTLGTNAKTVDINPKTLAFIQKVLSGLKQKILWKWDGIDIPDNSPNILYKRWLPQDDILAHPNVRLFITHCGMGSMAESQYHGVPMIAIPLFADQFKMASLIETSGFGVKVKLRDLTEEAFEKAVREVLENPKYRNAVQRFSTIYRDRPMSSRDTAAYWMEYVIRHRGARHLQSPMVHMSRIEYIGLDVIGYFSLVFYFVFKISKVISSILLCRLFKKEYKLKNE